MAPITNIIKNAYNSDSNKELYQILTNKLSNLGLDYYFENPESIKSTRIKKILEKIQYHDNERIVLFSCFKQPLYIIKQFISNRQLFIMESKMSSSQRGELIEKFKNSTNGILLLTYSIGAEGLNLQCSSTIMLIDFYWNSAKTNQAIARIYRYGQTANLVNIYMFISNTGIEKIIMKKQKAKQKIIQELFSGVATTKIPKLSISEIVKLIEKANNKNLLNNVYQNYDNVYNPNIYNNQPVLTI
jgi:SNF2 family DNA or RNA helicase